MRAHSLVACWLLLVFGGCGDESAAEPVDAVAAGWSLRFDDPDEKPSPMRFVQHSDGIEAAQGPNACLWHPELQASGDYRLSVHVTHLDSGLHPHGAGLTFGGQDLLGDSQSYTYFLVRRDQNFLIKTRSGEETADVVSWTEHEAVAPEDEQLATRNLLGVEVRGDEVRFLVNGVEVHRAERNGLPTEGRIGLRLVHDLHVKFGGLKVEPL